MLQNITPEWLGAFVSLGWLALALLVFIAALPILLRLTREKSFSVSVAGFQVSVQNATEQIGDQLRDLQDRIRQLEASASPPGADTQVSSKSPTGPSNATAPIATPPTTARHLPRRILWVDDFPSNNAFAVEKLRSDGFEVVLCESTSAGLRKFRDQEFGFVISDMGRQEKDGNNPTAGLDLLRLIRGVDTDIPVVIFASRSAVARHHAQAIALGALDITSSTVTLFEHIASKFGDS